MRRSTVLFNPVCCSGRACRRTQAICLSTRWFKTQLMVRCCESRDGRCMLASPTPIESGFADIAEKQPEVLARHFTEAERIEEAAALWGKAGQRLLERSALVEAPAVAIRVKKNPTLSSPPLPPGMSANRAHLALGCLSRLAETSKKAAKYWIDSVALPLFIE